MGNETQYTWISRQIRVTCQMHMQARRGDQPAVLVSWSWKEWCITPVKSQCCTPRKHARSRVVYPRVVRPCHMPKKELDGVYVVAPHACRWVCQCKIHTHTCCGEPSRPNRCIPHHLSFAPLPPSNNLALMIVYWAQHKNFVYASFAPNTMALQNAHGHIP